ncbi:MAG: hypothetical protein JWQ43_3497 [Glaciihabitans sp.]|nr:hypothetical protein [Glaciihabitans sp.]
MPEEFWANAVFSVTPTILVGLIFWFVMRAIFRADRTERAIYSRIEAEERAKLVDASTAAPVTSEPSSKA